MKKSIFHLSTWFLALGLVITGCGKKTAEHDMHEGHESAEAAGPNNQLYDQVMAVHNEVMPKMDDVFKTKEKLKNKIATEQDMKDDEKKIIEATISRLDSAGEGMMVWMRQFNPPPDSLGEEQAKAYLEEEMVKVKKVKDDILQALEDGNGLMQ
jgi:hypothetical protein